ncbi:hypothetical protein AC629_42500 [Bradyrhizobium sp. NAS80.1]|nr:hypothetical protein AC629_42500 [Bradyrhizobium sp. NAS80.1]
MKGRFLEGGNKLLVLGKGLGAVALGAYADLRRLRPSTFRPWARSVRHRLRGTERDATGAAPDLSAMLLRRSGLRLAQLLLKARLQPCVGGPLL